MTILKWDASHALDCWRARSQADLACCPPYRFRAPSPEVPSMARDLRMSVAAMLCAGLRRAGQAGSTVRVTTQRCGEIGCVRVKPWFSKAAIGPVCRNEPDSVRSSVSSG